MFGRDAFRRTETHGHAKAYSDAQRDTQGHTGTRREAHRRTEKRRDAPRQIAILIVFRPLRASPNFLADLQLLYSSLQRHALALFDTRRNYCCFTTVLECLAETPLDTHRDTQRRTKTRGHMTAHTDAQRRPQTHRDVQQHIAILIFVFFACKRNVSLTLLQCFSRASRKARSVGG